MNPRSEKGKKMQGTKNRVTREIGSDYRCEKCKGRAVVYQGRVRINHKMDCEIRLRLLLTYPRFARILEAYRSNPN